MDRVSTLVEAPGTLSCSRGKKYLLISVGIPLCPAPSTPNRLQQPGAPRAFTMALGTQARRVTPFMIIMLSLVASCDAAWRSASQGHLSPINNSAEPKRKVAAETVSPPDSRPTPKSQPTQQPTAVAGGRGISKLVAELFRSTIRLPAEAPLRKVFQDSIMSLPGFGSQDLLSTGNSNQKRYRVTLKLARPLPEERASSSRRATLRSKISRLVSLADDDVSVEAKAGKDTIDVYISKPDSKSAMVAATHLSRYPPAALCESLEEEVSQVSEPLDSSQVAEAPSASGMWIAILVLLLVFVVLWAYVFVRSCCVLESGEFHCCACCRRTKAEQRDDRAELQLGGVRKRSCFCFWRVDSDSQGENKSDEPEEDLLSNE